jgi:geranylgeranyl pyrophosphate synthase
MSSAGVPPFEQVLEAAGERIRALMQEVELELEETTSSWGPELAAPAGDTLAAGGKRLRPLLVFICGTGADREGNDSAPLVRSGAAIELVHMASLVHDDVLDDAPLRRGRPTVYASRGPQAATATGDFLFSRAFGLLARNGDRDQVRVLSDACFSLSRGELMQREDAYARPLSLERYLERCELKTGSLFAAACKLGALASGREEPEGEALGRFGRKLGLAFQLLDDLLDVAGTSEAIGKRRGGDLLDGTVTLPLILAAQWDRELAELDLRAITRPEEAERICDLIVATDAPTETRRRALELAGDANAELDGALDQGTIDLLRLVADRVVDRVT